MTSIKTSLAYNTANNVLRILFPLITAPYVARVLSPDDLGLLAFANSYAGYFAVFAVLGIPYYGAREIAKVRNDIQKTSRLFSELFSIGLMVTVVVSMVYFISISFLDRFNQHESLFLLIGVSLYCSPFNIDWFYGGLENFKHITIRSMVIKIASMLLLFTCVRDRGDLLFYAFIAVFSTVASDVWNFVVLYKRGYRISFIFHGLKRHVKPLLLLFVSTVAVSIYTILDRLMLGFMSTYEQVAFYSYAMEISKVLLSVIVSLSAVAIPRVSYYLETRQYLEIERFINKSCALVVFFAVPICAGLIMSSPTLVPLFLGSAFKGSVIPLQILSSLIVLIGLNNLFAVQCLVGLGYDKLFLYSVLGGTLTNFSLNFLLIPYLGAIGASIASAIAEFIVLVMSYYYVHRYTQLNVGVKREYVITVVAACLLVPLYMILSNFIDGWLLILCFVLFAIFIYCGVQYYAKNSILLLFIDLIQNKYNHFRIVRS